jgi:DNA repair exonuclease SbcCD ATPase subunit
MERQQAEAARLKAEEAKQKAEEARIKAEEEAAQRAEEARLEAERLAAEQRAEEQRLEQERAQAEAVRIAQELEEQQALARRQQEEAQARAILDVKDKIRALNAHIQMCQDQIKAWVSQQQESQAKLQAAYAEYKALDPTLDVPAPDTTVPAKEEAPNGKGTNQVCAYCGKPIRKSPSDIARSKTKTFFCCAEHQKLWRAAGGNSELPPEFNIKCSHCGKQLHKPPSEIARSKTQHFFCSNEHLKLWRMEHNVYHQMARNYRDSLESSA